MSHKEAGNLKLYIDSFRNVFTFFFFLGKKARKTRVFYLLSFLPVIMALVIQFVKIFTENVDVEGIYIFSNMILTFYLQFLILILALFFGSSICSDELEGKTLTYLTTRPIPKTSLLLGKYAAYTLLVIIMTVVGIVLSFLVLNVNKLLDFSLYKILLRDVAVLSLGIMCYTAFFTFIGTFLKKSVMFGLIFSFGWENVIQYFPGSTQRFAIVHYLKSLLPHSSGGRFSFLLFRLEPTSPPMAVFMLFLITAVFLGVACVLFSKKEYVIQD
jgi:ABC-type transport system involved in multi-copper enzyme maturation permease subunit